MSIKDKYHVEPVLKAEYAGWILKKHYAHRMPSVMFAFGLYAGKALCGVCIYGMPCVDMNDGKCIFKTYRVKTLELNRLVINSNMENNVLSFFVSQTFRLLEKPLCLVSFSDMEKFHHGYIYQATNWTYTGLSEKGGQNKHYILNGQDIHGKTMTHKWFVDNKLQYDPTKGIDYNFELNGGKIIPFGLKHRYLMFLGSNKEKRTMKADIKYRISPYPKGDNKRYDASYEPEKQDLLF